MNTNRRRILMFLVPAGLATAYSVAMGLALGSAAASSGDSRAAADFYPEVEELYAQLAGSPVDRAEWEDQQQTLVQDLVQSCMIGDGFAYVRPELPPTSPSPRIYEPAWWRAPNVSLARETGLGYVVGSLLGAERAASVASPEGSADYLALPDPARAAYDAALDDCLGAEDVHGELTRVPPSDQLLADLRDALLAETLESGFDVHRAQVADCLRERGFDFTGPDDIYNRAEPAVQRIIGDISAVSADVEMRLSDALTIESEMAVAEAVCRAASADDVAQYLRPAFDEWLEANRVSVDSVMGDGR